MARLGAQGCTNVKPKTVCIRYVCTYVAWPSSYFELLFFYFSFFIFINANVLEVLVMYVFAVLASRESFRMYTPFLVPRTWVDGEIHYYGPVYPVEHYTPVTKTWYQYPSIKTRSHWCPWSAHQEYEGMVPEKAQKHICIDTLLYSMYVRVYWGLRESSDRWARFVILWGHSHTLVGMSKKKR